MELNQLHTLINNCFLLTSCGAVAYLFYLIFQYTYEVSDGLPRKKTKRDELKERRIKHLEQSAFAYYYSMAINSPDVLAKDLAKETVRELARNNKINSMYSRLKAI